jgi:hypothetical protein
MKYAVEMGSGAMIYIPRFIKIGSAIQKFIVGDSHIYIYLWAFTACYRPFFRLIISSYCLCIYI